MDSLFVIQGHDQGRRYTLDNSTVTIGRDYSNRIRLHDPEASRRHAEIRLSDSGRVIIDLESSNGLFINGKQIQSRRLNNGDQIQIGRTVLLFASRTLDVGAQEPLVDVFQEAESGNESRVLHSLTPEDSRRLFERSAENELKAAWLEKARAHLNFMYHATLAASRTLDVERLLDRILELIFQWAPVDRGCIFLYDADADKLIPKSSKTRKKGGRVKVSQTILNYAFRNQKGVLTSNAQSDERWDGSVSILQTGVKEAICVPMQGRYGLVGVVYIDVSRPFGDIPPNETQKNHDKSSCDATISDASALESKTPELPKARALQTVAKTIQASFDSDYANFPDSKLDLDTETIEDSFEISSSETNEYSAEVFANDEFSGGSNLSFSETEKSKLTLDHLKLMVAIGRQAALAIEDTQYYLGMAQAERLAAIGQTVAVLSHHIKNILQGIRGGSFLIHTGLNEHDETLVRKGWNIVEKNQTKISDLVLDMLTFSKERTPVWSFDNFNELMTDVVELMRGRAADLDVDLKFNPGKKVPQFYFDREQIHRAIVNLIGNALEASKDYEASSSSSHLTNPASEKDVPSLLRPLVEVTVEFKPEKKQVLVIVDDVGPGIPLEMREVLFRPFASKNKSGGTGLGLAVTHKIVQEHKGRITIDNSPLGGARFVVMLPLVLEKPVEDDPS